MRSFQGPDSLPEPINQRKIIRRATEYRLTEMNVSLDEPRNEHTTRSFNQVSVFVLPCNERPAKSRDAAAIDKNVSGEDAVLRIHSNDRSTSDKQRFLH